MQLQQLVEHFQAKKDAQRKLQAVHEQSQSFGLAYLALWAILEDFATRLGPMCQRVELKRSLQEWLAFLNEEILQTPKKIALVKFDFPKEAAVKIPANDLLQVLLKIESAINFYELLDTQARYRKRRNSIAHSGEVISKKVYDEFRDKTLVALNEIEHWLINHVSHQVELRS